MQLITADNVKGLSEAELEALAAFYDRKCWTATPSAYAAYGSDWEQACEVLDAELARRAGEGVTK